VRGDIGYPGHRVALVEGCTGRPRTDNRGLTFIVAHERCTTSTGARPTTPAGSRWGGAAGGGLVLVGLNPSTATRDKSDPTAAKVERVARAHGYDGFVLVNLCPVRATDCRSLPEVVDPRPLTANLRAITEVARAFDGVTLWAAWGAPILTRPIPPRRCHRHRGARGAVRSGVAALRAAHRWRPPAPPVAAELRLAFAPFDVAD